MIVDPDGKEVPNRGEFSRGEDVQKIYWEDSAHGTKYAAASPGNSRHQGGAAGDLPAGEFRDWLKSGNQDKYGLHFPVKGDEPHVREDHRVQPRNHRSQTAAVREGCRA